ncbi:MAG: bifunctional 2-C-methyl-D-erythritol 4-phosphate cytidylyltransferase/2-C-methyl-D-erythritol 2,4-cyclodiphosphate synthase [Proteobacteria bacterium]|nr:bifunctional 2-C-methyl-D-erythritol 4-phosphate cytidylyltransferase/2-C-methyl-D-erythritol 2,4-cyclodiphosphate synthase [Pseudomonadota bacterium]
MSVGALIVAAGTGERAGGGCPKQYQPLAGQPVLAWSVEAFAVAGAERIVVAIAPGSAEMAREAAGRTDVMFVEGGATRTASVRTGLAALGDVDVVLIHDAARPGLTPAMVAALVQAVNAGSDGAAPALQISDSLRRVDAANHMVGEVERSGLVRVQTPQAFRGAVIRDAYAALSPDTTVSDDLAVARAAGANIQLIPGHERLMKLTYAEDFAVLERLMDAVNVTCVGSGFDAHRFGAGNHVTLCGVRIPHDRGLLGHSDADAAWHALVDAILGALGEGDIGAHFPPSDPQWKGADSETFLRHAAQLARNAGATLQHVDITLICERPKIGPHREAMRARTAEVLGLPLPRVSVKATTTEQMGFTGRGEGLAAQATATLSRPA